ncbi:MAG: signal peptidase II [bacterium]|nr:signal peptidase II [bacterium]MDY4099073.1 signal peptidase II [Lachnospiraceae bacterium]
MNKNNGKRTAQLYAFGAVWSFLLILLDQWTKYLAVTKLKDQASFVLLKGVFELHYLENHGAAFGVLQGKKVFFVCVTVFMIVLLSYIYGKIPLERRFYPLHGICIALFAGAIGNFIDRIRNDYVIDFFYFSLINFPIFNVADIYVTCAMALFIVLFLFYYKEADLDRLTALVLPWKKHGVTKL